MPSFPTEAPADSRGGVVGHVLPVPPLDHRAEAAEFLRTRRDRIAPDEAGIIGGGRRRVPGLRREGVALLAVVSVEYYARMERGDLSRVSSEVLDRLPDVRLDEGETGHLCDLARAADPRPPRRRRHPGKQAIRPSLRRFLDATPGAPRWIRDSGDVAQLSGAASP